MVVLLGREALLPSSFFLDNFLLMGGEMSESVESWASELSDMDSALRFREGLAETVVRAMADVETFSRKEICLNAETSSPPQQHR